MGHISELSDDKWGKIVQNGPKKTPSMFRLFSWDMPHNCGFWLYALIIDKENVRSNKKQDQSSPLRFWRRVRVVVVVVVVWGEGGGGGGGGGRNLQNWPKLYESQRF